MIVPQLYIDHTRVIHGSNTCCLLEEPLDNKSRGIQSGDVLAIDNE